MSKKPNILFFFSDQQRWDTVGCYGQKLPVTPNLDRLAAEGTRFANAFTCQPVCGPARACLQTGLYATQTGCFRNNIALPLNQRTIAHVLKENGYQTAYVGKWHLASTGGKSSTPLEEPADYRTVSVPVERRGGYDWWTAADVLEETSHGYGGYVFDTNGKKREFTGYRADAITDYALEFLQQRDQEKPFFLFLSHIEPHHQNDHGRFEGPEGAREQFAHFEPPQDLVQAKEDWGADWKEQYPDYLGCCHSLDRNLGRLLEELKHQGIADDTIVIYASDHGSHFKTRCFEYKRSCHEASIHVPLIIAGGPFQNGGVYEQLVSLIDLPPTLLAAAGAEIPEEMQGKPLQSLLAGKPWTDDVFIQISESEVGRAIRTEKYKYCVTAKDKSPWQDSSSPVYEEEYLYDLEEDPYEQKNLVTDAKYAEIRKNLAQRLISHMQAAGEEVPEIRPAVPEEPETKFTRKTKISKIMESPEGKACLNQMLPGLSEHPQFSILKNMNFQNLGELIPQKFTEAFIAELEARLGEISVETSKHEEDLK